ncbi:beta-phosphoglucomutase family hydrolase [Chlorobium phaeobacteroides]|jgi:beta-phosphoglucomutase family hydrolase|uniref:Beta-phosphoglucomutase family hydrolase n=1 Tax=Chlorobium phaeobacteroides (strain DSM 266 / SMG 266 / 2430) TaxID=290317 RepID=A1BGY4_CHLPD|nr:beta-phosphoglucomutase family hydrolase [Chlorobium phaeobacteroides]ABL65661.1 beta-phosphoglucomutase family hydrolase [Chlorobium phaeobacteroides DSM 266]MBV5328374.1 beta-phosphoglucomutase family hydrolase [Chlorobium sp.]
MSNLFKGAIFDLDGVITGTAKVHSLAWEAMFNSFLKSYAEENNEPFVPFDPVNDYHRYVDGKPRMEGVKSFLASRNIELHYGDLDDNPEKETVCGLGNRKNSLFTEILMKEGPEIYTSSVDLIKELIAKGIRIGIASSSRNCQLILQLANLEELFETRVDGEVSIELNLKGKPNPDIFVTAAANLGLEPHECVVVEDAISGVQAGSRGNFGLVLGIAREIEGSKLRQEGADIVVKDLGEITISDIELWFNEGLEKEGWNLEYSHFSAKDEKLRETLTSVGNGYLGVRGAYEGSKASGHHYPGTYIAGIFNKLPSDVHGQTIFNNDFVNCPNWLPIEFRIGKGSFTDPFKEKILSYRQNLDMQNGSMTREIVIQDNLGRISRISSQRFASMANPHICAVRFILRPINYQAEVEFRSSIDGQIENKGVTRYRELASDHLEHVYGITEKDSMFLHVETNASHYGIVTGAVTRVFCHTKQECVERSTTSIPRYIAQTFRIPLSPEKKCTIEKIVTIHTSLDEEKGDPLEAAKFSLLAADSFDSLFNAHIAAWEKIWKKTDLKIQADRFSQKALRLHTYHMMCTASPHNASIDAGMPARGLNGEAYRGHIFWDEIFILPFFNRHYPDIAKALLMYRYHRLDAAREYAREHGFKGAMFPWQTADDGKEDSQIIHFNPKSGTWGPDLSRKQRHVSIAVFFNTWLYIYDTADTQFLDEYGAEMMFEIARFWASIASFSPETGRYHIEGIMGPDEFHETLPGSGKEGLRDNSYTNIMTVWLLEKAVETAEKIDPAVMRHLLAKINLGYDELQHWRDISSHMNILLDENGILEQFDGYMSLKELDWSHYRSKYGNIHRMDRILKAEGDSPDNYKVAKQADVLMTFYTLSPEEVARLLEKNGYTVDDPQKLVQNNYNYYEPRTCHGSTLSKVVHSIISSYLPNGREAAWRWFSESLKSDILDTQGGTTQEGIHCGVMAGTLDMVMRYFAGISFEHDMIHVNPNLPEHWKKLELNVLFRANHYVLSIESEKVSILLTESESDQVQGCINKVTVDLKKGIFCTV